MRPCWILTYARTGSTCLGRLLNATNAFTPPFSEYYAGASGKQRIAEMGCPPPYNKMMFGQYTKARKRGEVLNEYYPDMCFVYLRRKDIVASAVSQYFMNHTKVANINQKNVEQAINKYQSQKIPYDQEALTKLYWEKMMGYHYWDHFVKGTDHIEVYYEDVIANPENQVARIMNLIGTLYQGMNPDEYTKEMRDKQTVKLEHPDKERYTKKLKKALVKTGVISLFS